MANYHYDEAGSMAAFFLISVLVILLTPFTIASLLRLSAKRPEERVQGCQCKLCVHHRSQILPANSAYPKFTKRAVVLLLGWSLVAFLVHVARSAQSDNKVYDPYEILGISTGATEKEIKSLFKKLSKIYHPDKVRATVNETAEQVANRFVEITKAYKSLTDETIRRNYELYGHPDGRQEVSMGIAIPSWIIEGKNNVWVLGCYAIVIGGLLPGMVGRWWFGSRGKTKDGVEAKTAEDFWKGIEEATGIRDIVKSVGNAFKYESRTKNAGDLSKIQEEIGKRVAGEWEEASKAVADDDKAHRALTLLYAHFLRLDLGSKPLEREQSSLLLQTPVLLNAFLNIAAARSWLAPTLGVMRLHAYLAQAIVPGKVVSRQAQLTGCDGADSGSGKQDQDERASEASKALQSWGSLEIVDMGFKVIGERLVTPSSIVFLLVKLRVNEPGSSAPTPTQDVKSTKRNEEIDEKFLNTRGDAEEIKGNSVGHVHAPYWPALRKPGWWLVLADDKSNRIVVPPMKINDVPRSDPSKERNYRCYKIQFQAPPNVGLFTWKVYFVSDTIVGDETCRPISLKIDEVSALAAEDQTAEDDISDPEEDSLAGQMAAMRGAPVKKVAIVEESDDDSSMDESESDADDSSDSD